mmetsp:Transcript_35582/g.101339  ORF Transcript_35582/g.101339 Transcript_35582/m.101339 type:complete len:355 (+) Transcript_35582:81-1145(+)
MLRITAGPLRVARKPCHAGLLQLRRAASGLTAGAGAGGVQTTDAGSVTIRQRLRARPLEFTQRMVLYRSEAEVVEVADSARRNCRIGAGLGAVGFAGIIAAIAPAAPPPVLAMMLGGALANSYALAFLAQRLIRKLAARHVERLVVLPSETPKKPPKAPASGEEEGEIASLLFSAATVEERLEATEELRVELHTGTAKRWFSLIDAPEQAGAFGEEVPQPASFADVCGRSGLLHVDKEEGSCPDPAFLDALLSSKKIVVDERLEPREDTGEDLSEGAPVDGLLGELSRGDAEEIAQKTAAAREPPAEAIAKLGRRARLGGVSILVAGALFLLGEGARDADGVARWRNLRKLLSA